VATRVALALVLSLSLTMTSLLAAVANPAGPDQVAASQAAANQVGASQVGAKQSVGNRVLVLGDSLSAEYGLRRGSGWVALLEARLAQARTDFTGNGGNATVVNASISGETTAGGWSRLAPLLERHRPAVVVIALGANDALRGLDLGTTEANLGRMIDAAKAAGARPVLVGMMLPPNYGRAYADRFAALYPDLARKRGAALVPFLLDGFAGDTTRFQSDRIHPNESAQQRMLDNVWPAIEALAS
jgi:acyl-CoA thioesterase-1